MYKPLEYPTLDSVVQDFIKEYSILGHSVIKVKLSAPIIFCESTILQPIPWAHTKV